MPSRPEPDAARDAFRRIRRLSETLCEPLEVEDYVAQSMPEASPIRWHLAHTTWFFETFVLKPFAPGYVPVDSAFESLFNSYYEAVGKPFPRHRRGVLTRPTVAEVFAFRQAVDEAVERLIEGLPRETWETRVAEVLQIGLQHEQQHQELMLTDIKHLLGCNPLYPAYRSVAPDAGAGVEEVGSEGTGDGEGPDGGMRRGAGGAWEAFEQGIVEIGHGGVDAFCYDNETPRHREWVDAFQLATRLVTGAEYLRFIEEGGYREPAWWLSDGWATVEQEGWSGPLYWVERDRRWFEFTLAGLVPLDLEAPVCHLSYFEADAYARWAGARLPTEAEWERASEAVAIEGPFVESQRFHPSRDPGGEGLRQMFGDLWQWTSSPYVGYPGYQRPDGALGEYNGKFMCNQFVLRGGSVATSRSHIRRTYRNFFPPQARWQFTGIRLAR